MPNSARLAPIDLQNSNVRLPLALRSASTVISNSVLLVDTLRAQGALVIFTRVLEAEMDQPPVDLPVPKPSGPPLADASELHSEIHVGTGDIVLTKRHWGAVHGTKLVETLRERRIKQVLVGARCLFDESFDLVFVEDAMSSLSLPLHAFPMENVFPRMGQVRATHQILSNIAERSMTRT